MSIAHFARRLGIAAAFAVTVTAGLTAFDNQASALSSKVHNACRADYHTFCPGYSLDSPALRHCMKSAGRRLALACRRALAAEGEIPAKYGR